MQSLALSFILSVRSGIRGPGTGLMLLLAMSCSPMSRKETSEHFAYVFNSQVDSATVKEVAQALENNYLRISKALNTVPVQPIEVFLYSNRWDYARATGHWTASGNVRGPAQLHFLPEGWAVKEYQKTAVHEFAHAVTLKLLMDHSPQPVNEQKLEQKFARLPVWLWEGIACYQAGEFEHPRAMPYFTDGRTLTLQELNSRKGEKIYKVGYLLIEYVLHQYGQDQLIELLTRDGELPSALKVSEAEFERGWHQFVQDKYLKPSSPGTMKQE
ncbi:MAG: hypothetical protein ICV83_08825 [Cytophagales bacterium]|nr:hypothetical protein [Cytophagales bacterium]